MHDPLLQKNVPMAGHAPQTTPQPPQFFGSVVMSTQVNVPWTMHWS
jgi:hypothetical protein